MEWWDILGPRDFLAPGPPISFWVTCASLVNLGCSSYCVKGFGWAAAAEIMEQPMCTWRDMIWPTLLWHLLFIIFLVSFKFNFIKKFSALNMKQAGSVGHMPLLIAMHNCVRTRKNTGRMQLWIKQRVQQRTISMIAALRLQGRMHPNVGEERWKWTQWKYVFWGFSFPWLTGMSPVSGDSISRANLILKLMTTQNTQHLPIDKEDALLTPPIPLFLLFPSQVLASSSASPSSW